MRIGIIAGHTDIVGKDRGAYGKVIEGWANRIQAIACYNELRKYNCEPFLEPEGYPLNDEIYWVNRNNLDLAVAMHNNAGGGDGWEALVSVTGSGDELGKIAEKHIMALGQNSRGIKKRRNASGGNYYGFIRQTNCTAVIFETAFVDNTEDVKFIDTESENVAIGQAYAKAIVECYGIKEKGIIAVATSRGQKYPYALPTKEAFPMGRRYNRTVDVKKWQSFCVWIGVPTAVDGIFGIDTERVTKIVQTMLGTPPDGIVGADTIRRATPYRK